MLLFEEELRYLSSHSAMLTAQQKTVAYLWQHQLSASQLKDLAQLLFPCLDLNKYASFSSKRLTERLSVDILAQALCGPSAQIGHTESGQPYLSALPVEISVSHSGNTYALSVSPRPHGMDIEKWDSGARALRIAHKFLSAQETHLLDAFSYLHGREEAATMLWSAKEAVFKRFNRNGLQLLSDIRLSNPVNRQIQAFVPRLKQHCVVDIMLYPHCVCTCSE